MDSDLHRLGMRLKFFYSLGGLLIGLVCILGGCVLFLGGVVGSTSWTFNALGIAESNVTDAAPGSILFVVGLFFVVFTRFKVHAKVTEYDGNRGVEKIPKEPDKNDPLLLKV